MTTFPWRGLVLAFLTLLTTAPAMAKDKKPFDPNKVTCRLEIPTGSRFPVRQCRTAAIWAQIDGSAAGAADAAMDRATRNGPGSFPLPSGF